MAIAVGYAIRNVRHPTIRKFLIDSVFERHFGWRKLELRTRTRFGSLMHLTLPDSLQTRLFLTGHWEPRITDLISTALAPGDTFIDIGANVGYYTLLASGQVGEHGNVFAFEASPSIFRRLQLNVSSNRMHNVSLHNVAIGNKPGKVWIWTAPEGNLGHSTIIDKVAAADGHRREAEVPCDTLSSLVPLPNLLGARLIKMDIEGAERLAIEGIVQHLKQFSERTEWVVELSPTFSPGGARDIEWIFNTFIDAGYSAFKIENRYVPLSSDQAEIGAGHLAPLSGPPSEPLADVLFSRNGERP